MGGRIQSHTLCSSRGCLHLLPKYCTNSSGFGLDRLIERHYDCVRRTYLLNTLPFDESVLILYPTYSPKIIQTLLIPGCSFFNTIPSLHLHLLIRQNPPKLAIWFSSLFAFVYLFSTLLMLGTCASAPSAPRGLAHSECPRGIRGGPTIGVDRNVWDVFQVMSLLSVVAYSVHAAMAIYVLRDQKRKKALGLLIEDPEVVAARRAKAREQWIQMTRQHGGNA